MAYYGIDLGTTNSLIGNAATGYLSDLVPSCVDPDTHKAGSAVSRNINAIRSFKIDMSLGIEGALPIQASRYVLEELKRQAGPDVKDVLISVPAYFSDNQRQATIKAAELAKLNVIGIINEPTAAAAYISKNEKRLFVVMDLGGGTFDVSIIDSRYGTYIVMATDGRIVGGDNLDKNIYKYLSKNANIFTYGMSMEHKQEFRLFCTDVKIQMAENYGKDLTLDLSKFHGPSEFKFTKLNYKKLLVLTFQETIDLTKKLIEQNIPNEDYSIVLVGGSTKNPYYKDMVSYAFGKEKIIPMTYDPDRVVAQGAAYCAMLKENGQFTQQIQDVTKGLLIGIENGMCRMLVQPNSVIPLSTTHMFTNSSDCNVLKLLLYQGSSMLQKENELIGELAFDYGEMKIEGEGVVYVTIEITEDGIIKLICEEPLGEKRELKLDRIKI